MENWILVIGYSRPHFEAAQKEWLKYNVLLQSVDTIPEAIEKFSTRLYLAVIASYDVPNRGNAGGEANPPFGFITGR